MLNTIQENKIPIFKQVAGAIKKRIRKLGYSPGDSLPSLRQLGREYGVSLAVAQRAIRSLEQDGVVKVRPGKGITIANSGECDKTAFLFGLLHPYEESAPFAYLIIGTAQKVFTKQFNFVVAKSTQDSAILERKSAELFVDNGIQGLLVWPTQNDRNNDFFIELSKRIPVVIVDRILPDSTLPTVVMDFENCGLEICNHTFTECKRKRLLVIMDNLEISSYRSITSGIESQARKLGRFQDITIIQLPVSRMINQYYQNEFDELIECRDSLRRIISEGEYDSIFAFQDEFVDYVIAQLDLLVDLPDVHVATLRSPGPDNYSMKYKKLKPFAWLSDMEEMISVAANWLGERILGNGDVGGVKKIKIRLADKSVY